MAASLRNSATFNRFTWLRSAESRPRARDMRSWANEADAAGLTVALRTQRTGIFRQGCLLLQDRADFTGAASFANQDSEWPQKQR